MNLATAFHQMDENIFKNSQSCVMVDQSHDVSINLERGTRQGDALSIQVSSLHSVSLPGEPLYSQKYGGGGG